MSSYSAYDILESARTEWRYNTMRFNPFCILVPNMLLKTRRKISSKRFRRHNILPFRRHQPCHIPDIHKKAGSILLEHVTRNLRLCHRCHCRHLEVFSPQSRAPLAAIHTFHTGGLDHIRSRTASGSLFKASPRQSEQQTPTMDAYIDHNRCVPDDHSNLANSLASIQSL